MKYSRQATLDYAKLIDKETCLKLIERLIVTEGFTGTTDDFQGDEMVLDMDCVERRVASFQKRSPNKSMDSAFVAEDAAQTISEIVFVEYRFNYKSMRFLKKEDLYEKVAGSRLALGNPANIHSDFYFVFDTNLKQQAIRYLYSLNPRMPQNYAAVDMNDVINSFFL